jgi:hypothetical protein
MADPAYIVNGTLTDGEAWVPIATTTLSGSAASTTFTSTNDGQVGDWSQYMDLVVVLYVASTNSGDDDFMKTWLNADTTAANYRYQAFGGDARPAAEATASITGPRGIDTRRVAGANATNVFAAMIMNFHDVNSGKYKTAIVNLANDIGSAVEGGQVGLIASTWMSQAPITSIQFAMTSAALQDASMFSLFGVLPRMVA